MELAISASIAQLDADTTLPANQKYIILLTDGQWNRGEDPLTSSDATPDAVSKGYKIFTIGLGNGVSQTLLQNIADATGGKYYFASDANALNNIFNQIYQDINTAATNLVVTDILPNYIKLDGSPTVQPNSIVSNPDGTTTMIWNVGTLAKDQTWTVKYNLRSTRYGLNLPTNIKGLSMISYTDPDGVQATAVLPVPVVSFEDPQAKTTATNNTLTTGNTETSVNAANTISMQEAGAPFGALIVSLLMLFAGMVLPRHK